MLQYTLNGEYFLLDTDTSIRLTWTNPACNFDEFPGDVGMGLSIPVNDRNSALLGYPERFERYSLENDLEFTGFEIRYSGVLLMAGTLVIQNANSESYSGWLRSTVGNLGKEHKEKYIYDIEAFNQDITWENKANYDPDVDDYGCPRIFNPEFFKDKGRRITVSRPVRNPDYIPELMDASEQFFLDDIETEAFTQAFWRTTAWFVNSLNGDNTVKALPDSGPVGTLEVDLDLYVVTPMLFLNRVIDYLVKDASLNLNDNFIESNEDFKKLVVYNNYDITDIELLATTEQYIYIDWYNDEDAGVDIAPSKSLYQILDTITRKYDGTFKYRNLLPKVQIKDFILGVQNLINVFFHFRHDGKVDIIDREPILDGDVIDISEYMVGTWEMARRKMLRLNL